jgi:hypothetical protein
MDPTLATVIRPADSPLVCQQDDGSWHLDLDDTATIVLSTDQVRRIVDDFLEQSLGGPIEADAD